MKLKKLTVIAVSLSMFIGALSITENFPSGISYNANAAVVPEDAPKSLADIDDTSSWYYQSCPTTGDVKALCFLVDFPDVKNENSLLNAETTKEALNSRVSEFYNTSSYGKFNIDYDVYGWYTFENDRDYCGSELGYQGMLREVMTAYDDEIDYSEYDANKDGMLDLVYLFYAGPNDGSGNHFWWSLVTNGLGITTFDEKTIPKFAFINLEGSQYNYFYLDSDTVIHETGHILGLADYYDVNSHGGLDSVQHGNTGGFDIMDFMLEGDHNIFSKMMLGWVEPVFVTQDMTFDVSCVSDETAKAYIIAPDFKNGVFSEYFVVEFYKNVENNEYSIKCPEGAIRIYHVDATYDSDLKTFIYDNSETEHPLINLVESDGEYANLRYVDLSYTKDYYTEGMTFGINTAPSTEFYEGEFTGINITVNSIDGDSANVSVTFNNVDKEAPVMTKYVMPNAFGRVTNLSGTQIYFSSHIFEGENFKNVSYSPVASPDEKVYPDSYIVKHPQSKDYSFNSIFITELSAMKDNTDYVLTIPAGAVVDSSGNPNEETTIKFTTCGGTSSYTEVEYPDFEKIASGAPEDSMMDTNYLERLPLKNGNTLFLHRVLVPFGEYTDISGYDFKIYSPQNELVAHTYIKDDKGATLNLFELNNDTLLFATNRNYYYIVSLDGVILEDGTYSDSDHTELSEFCVFENSIDFVDGFRDKQEFYICRFNFDGTIERFGPILPLSPSVSSEPSTSVMAEYLYRYNSDYTEFDSDEQNGIGAIVDTRSFYYEKYDDFFAYSYGISRFHDFNFKEGNDANYAETYISDNYIGYMSTVHDSEVLCNKTAKNGVPLVDVNGGYVANLIGASEFLLNDDGQLLVYDVEFFLGTGQFHDEDGYFIVRLNKDLEVMWDCAVPFYPNSAFCSGDKVYVFSNDGIYAFDDSATEPIFAKDEVTFTDTFEVDTENQEIKGGVTTAEQIKTNLVKGDADVVVYDLNGKIIPDSEKVEEAIVEIRLPDSAYTYYYHYISAESYNISGTITTGTDDIADVTVELLDSEGELVQTAQLTDTGYEFTDVEQGKYTIVVSTPKYCTREYSVEVGEENVELDVEIHLYGDVNFDGVIDSKDATQILYYNSQLNSVFSLDDELTTEYRFKVADVDQNEIIDSKDATQILRYASDLSSAFDNIE